MFKNPRHKVIKFTERPNDYEGSKHIFPTVCEATLECSHVINLGVGSLRPKRMACNECGKLYAKFIKERTIMAKIDPKTDRNPLDRRMSETA